MSQILEELIEEKWQLVVVGENCWNVLYVNRRGDLKFRDKHLAMALKRGIYQLSKTQLAKRAPHCLLLGGIFCLDYLKPLWITNIDWCGFMDVDLLIGQDQVDYTGLGLWIINISWTGTLTERAGFKTLVCSGGLSYWTIGTC